MSAIMEFRFDMFYSNFANQNSDAGHINTYRTVLRYIRTLISA